ncbi:hypothetical protein K5D56_21580 [Pseudomonas cichorii]|nr:hypothetical protein [Pseudomonas cichorii]MBX8557059.1 hypothetical protein [Pseudomonas cichorii]MBX8591960.1 hypothetical protein [Pseudomonas cichorii]
MNLQSVKGLTSEDQCEQRKRNVFLWGIKLIHEQDRFNNYLAQLIFLKPSPAILQQTDSLRYDMWIALVADRLMELGVPVDEVCEHVIDFPWFRDRFDDNAFAWPTAEEYFHWILPYGGEDTPEDAVPKIFLSERIAYDPANPEHVPF